MLNGTFTIKHNIDGMLLRSNIEGMPLYYSDGGRKEAGFESCAGDCFVRAISIACELDYKEVWNQLNEYKHKLSYQRSLGWNGRNEVHKTPDKGVSINVANQLLEPLGWKEYEYTTDYHWDRQAVARLPLVDSIEASDICNSSTPPKASRGRKVSKSLIPKGRCIILLNTHAIAVVDHKLYDKGDTVLGRSGSPRFVKSFFFPVAEEGQEQEFKPMERTIEVEKPVKKVNRRRKLTDEQVREIRFYRNNYNMSLEGIGLHFGISGAMVHNICARKVYKHVD